MPLNTPNTALPGDTLSDTLKSAGGMDTGSPATVPVSMPTKFGRTMQFLSGGNYDPTGGQDSSPESPSSKPTKFGMLMKVLGPALQGGLIGMAGGKGHPQGGFGAANDFFARQRMMQMQNSMLQRQLYNDQFKNLLEYARTQHEMSLPPITRIPNAIKGKDGTGNEIYMTLNPHSMQYEPIQGISPDTPGDTYRDTMTNQGLVTLDTKKGTHTLATLENGKPAPIPTGPPQVTPEPGNESGGVAQFAGQTMPMNRPRTPGSGTASQSPAGVAQTVPLRPPSFGQPKPAIRASRNSAGVETDNVFDTDPNSPTFGKKIGALNNARQPVRDRTGKRKEDTEATQAQIEQYAGEALKRNGNDPDKAIQFMNGLQVGDTAAQKKFQAMLPKIRQHIRDRMKQGKRRLTLSPQDANAAGLTPTASSVTGEDDDDQ